MFSPDVQRLRDTLRAAGIAVDTIKQVEGVHTFAQLMRIPEGRKVMAAQAE